MNIVSVDLGYGYIKAVSSNGKKVLFPSLVGRGHDRTLSGLFYSPNNDLTECHFKINGEHYFIGELAKRESSTSTRIFEQDRYTHEYTRILLNAAIQLVSDENVVRLVTGLPLDFYQSQAKEVKSKIQGIYPELEWVSGPLGKVNRKISVEQALVFPQGAGAILSALLSEQLTPVYPELMEAGVKVGLVDIGFRTTDYIVVEMQGKGMFKPLPNLSGTIDNVGVNNLYKDILRAYKDMTGGADLKEEYIDRIIRQKMIKFRGQPLKFHHVIESSLSGTCTRMVDVLKLAWANDLDLLDAVFIAGGGGELYYPYLNPHFNHQLQKVEDSQFANATGYLKLGRAMWQTAEAAG